MGIWFDLMTAWKRNFHDISYIVVIHLMNLLCYLSPAAAAGCLG